MEKLSNELEIKGTGFKGLTAKLIKRNGNICLYERSDGVFETFFVNVNPARELFGKHYPERESYPCNEDFGKTAWCFKTLGKAMAKFNALRPDTV